MSISLDGFVETPSRSLDWVQVDEEVHSFVNDQGARAERFPIWAADVRADDRLLAEGGPAATTFCTI